MVWLQDIGKGLPKKKEPASILIILKNDTFRKLKSINGFIAASILTRGTSEGVEFLIVTKWKSLEAIKSFTGHQEEVAVVPAVVQDIMIRYDEKVTHYEINYESR